MLLLSSRRRTPLPNHEPSRTIPGSPRITTTAAPRVREPKCHFLMAAAAAAAIAALREFRLHFSKSSNARFSLSFRTRSISPFPLSRGSKVKILVPSHRDRNLKAV